MTSQQSNNPACSNQSYIERDVRLPVLFESQSRAAPSPRVGSALLGCFIGLFVCLPLHPPSVGEERQNSERDEEHDAKHQHHTRILMGPVLLSFGEQVKSLCLGPVDQANGGHRVLGFRMATAVGC